MRSSDWSSDVCSSDLLKALPDASLAGGYVLFPDPWPKKRHQWRRIVNPDTLTDWARLLPRGHELRLATDVPDYQRWIDRKSVVSGKSVSVRVDLGGRRIIKKKNITIKIHAQKN